MKQRGGISIYFFEKLIKQKMAKKIIRKEIRGVTLISLIVTIIVLLILAGVTVDILVGDNGIVKEAEEKTEDMRRKAANEEVKTLVTEYDVAKDGETLEKFLKSKVPTRIDGVTRINDDTLEVKKDGFTIKVEDALLKITINLTAYVGTYDGIEHNVLTEVSVSPNDVTLEYSTNGIDYSATMPTITNASSISVTVRASKDGYKTEMKTVTSVMKKAEGKLTLASTSGTYTYPNGGNFNISESTGTLSVSSSNTNIASASLNGNSVIIVPGTVAGKSIITVTSAESENYTSATATYTATVNNGTISLSATPYTGTYDGKAHNALTSVSVNPSDAKIEYSTDGTNYSTTMPTITNTSSFTVIVKASKAGYKTQTTTQTVKVNKAAGTLTLSATSGTINYPNSTTFTVSGNTGTLSVSSSNTSVATASISGNTVTVKSVGVGTATITVKSAASTNYNEKTATYTATVKYFTEDSGVGYYADTDGDGTPDGIIFEDFKKGGSGSWGGYSYTIPTKTDLKEYYISQTNYNGPFGTKDVLTATGSGNARFYVMALSDYDDGRHYTFEDACEINGEWSVPEIDELAAFGRNLGITSSNYSGYGLQHVYWSSTNKGLADGNGYDIKFWTDLICVTTSSVMYSVRLARTF